MARFVISLSALERNARILRQVADESGASVILALKGFATTAAFPVLRPFMDGCCASGLYEARLAARHAGGHIAVYSPAYRDGEVEELAEFVHHIDFNSLSQWERFRGFLTEHPRFRSGELLCGLRINPQFSTGHTALYDPCAPGSRLGVTADALQGADLSGISGLHFHTLCEQGAEDLAATLEAVEEKFGFLLSSPQISYLNMGGGHWVTKPGYNRALLVELVRLVRARYGVDVVLEPGEAWAIHTGVLRCRVLDVFESQGVHHAILDVSASAHMPDVLEMPYRPDLFRVGEQGKEGEAAPAAVRAGEVYALAGEAGEKAVTYRLGAPTCLAGDMIGDYSFDAPLAIGDELVFDDMAHYTIVKTTFFNGVPHPSIAVLEPDGTERCVKELSYCDFESRLG